MGRVLTIVLLLVLTAACGGAAVSTGSDTPAPADSPVAGGGDVASMCMEGVPDCNDTPDTDINTQDSMTPKQLRQTARDLLGLAEDELPQGVRIGRRGDEQMMLTEDYRIGRMTVELDEDDAGVFRVTLVVLEMEDGPETFTAKN